MLVSLVWGASTTSPLPPARPPLPGRRALQPPGLGSATDGVDQAVACREPAAEASQDRPCDSRQLDQFVLLRHDGTPPQFPYAVHLAVHVRGVRGWTSLPPGNRTEPSPALVAWDPRVSFLTRWTDRLPLMTARGVPVDVRGFLDEVLHRRVEALSECWAGLSSRGHPRVLIHGDTFPNNAVLLDDGTLALVDLDYIGVGPPEVDLSAALIQYVRHDQEPAALERIHAAYHGSVDDRLLAHIYAADEAIELVWLSCLWGSCRMPTRSCCGAWSIGTTRPCRGGSSRRQHPGRERARPQAARRSPSPDGARGRIIVGGSERVGC